MTEYPDPDSPFMFRRRKRAQATFTDREEPTKTFVRQLELISSVGSTRGDRAQILQFYGVGGIGKSRLLNECMRIARGQFPDSIIAHVDFDDTSKHDAHRALLQLRRSIQSDRLVDFRHFDLAYALFFAKRNPDFTFEKSKLPYLEEAGVVGNVVASIDGLGIVGAIKGIIEQVHSLASSLLIEEEAKYAIEELKFMTEREVEEVLPDFLAFDLSRQTLFHSPTLIAFDTYEKLWADDNSERNRFVADGWVRRLALGLPRALFVIAGREIIEWASIDSAWDEFIERHLLGNLDSIDAARFIRSVGVEDEALVSKMVDLSSGHPFYLDLCLDAFYEGKLSGISQAADVWPENKRELFDRFIRNISPVELSLLVKLAPLSSYTKEYAAQVIKEFNVPIDLHSVTEHFRYSFVKQEEESGEAVIHEIMRKALVARTPKEQVESARLFALKFFSSVLSEATNRSTDADLSRAIRECAHQLVELRNPIMLQDWLNGPLVSAIDEFQIRATPKPLLQALGRIESVFPSRDWPAKLRTAYADMTHLTGQYGRAIVLLDEQLSRFRPDEIYNDEELSFAVVRRLHHRMMIESMAKIWDEALEEIPKLESGSCWKSLGECYFLLGGNLAATQGKNVEGVHWINKALEISRQTNDDRLLVRCMRKISDFYRITGRLNRARNVISEGLNKSEGGAMRRYHLYLRCALGDLERIQGNLSVAASIFWECRAECANLNLEGWLGHTYLGHAATALQQNDLDNCEHLLDMAERYYTHTNHAWGITQVALHRLHVTATKRTDPDTWMKEAKKVGGRAHSLGYLRDAGRCELAQSQFASTQHAIAFL